MTDPLPIHLPRRIEIPYGTGMPHLYVDATSIDDARGGKSIGILGLSCSLDQIHLVDYGVPCEACGIVVPEPGDGLHN